MLLKTSSQSVSAAVKFVALRSSHCKGHSAGPRISEVVQETKVLLQQSRERLVITCVFIRHFPFCTYTSLTCRRVSNDISAYDSSKYHVSISPSPLTGERTFHLGEPITIKWQAPHKHSRKDWIGLYRVGFCYFRVISIFLILLLRSGPINRTLSPRYLQWGCGFLFMMRNGTAMCLWV